MHGPPGMFSPTWTFPIQVIDTVALSLRPKRQLKWQAARDAALANWTPMTFAVSEADPADHPALDMDTWKADGAYIQTVIVPGALRLMPYRPLGLSTGAFAWYEYQLGGGLCGFYMPEFWLRTPRRKVYVIGHEVGHNLGLNHPPAGTGGIMAGSYHPNEHDLESVAAYYAEVP